MLNLLGFDYVHEMRYIVNNRVLFEKYSGLVYLFYDTASDRMKMIPADPDFRAYFLTELGAKLPNSRYIIGRKKVTKFDRIKYEDREFLKVETSEPIGVRNVSAKTRGEVWENRILFHLNEAYDKKIVFGCNHLVLEGKKKLDIILPITYEGDLSKYYLDIFEMPTYSYRRCAIDIEIKGDSILYLNFDIAPIDAEGEPIFYSRSGSSYYLQPMSFYDTWIADITLNDDNTITAYIGDTTFLYSGYSSELISVENITLEFWYNPTRKDELHLNLKPLTHDLWKEGYTERGMIPSAVGWYWDHIRLTARDVILIKY